MITNRLHIEDDVVLSILHLLISEIGGVNEDAFDVHEEGLRLAIEARGGITNLASPHFTVL